MSKEDITTDLSDFGSHELTELMRLINAWNQNGLPEDFEASGVVPMFNRNSGCVFLTNSEYQIAMREGDELRSFYHCSNCGEEGFVEDCELNDPGCNHCKPEESKDTEISHDRLLWFKGLYERMVSEVATHAQMCILNEMGSDWKDSEGWGNNVYYTLQNYMKLNEAQKVIYLKACAEESLEALIEEYEFQE